MEKQDNKKYAITMRFTPLQYYQLKKLADINNRGMNDEVITLIEKVAANMRMRLDQDDDIIQNYIQSEAERLGISPESAFEKVEKKYYERQKLLIENIKPQESESKLNGVVGMY